MGSDRGMVSFKPAPSKPKAFSNTEKQGFFKPKLNLTKVRIRPSKTQEPPLFLRPPQRESIPLEITASPITPD
jgi:hypothetical protein